jgi:hypothetical protein
MDALVRHVCFDQLLSDNLARALSRRSWFWQQLSQIFSTVRPTCWSISSRLSFSLVLENVEED